VDINTAPTATQPASPKLSPQLKLFIIALLSFLVGAGLMLIASKSLPNLQNPTTAPALQNTPKPVTQLLQSEIADPKKTFGILAQDSYVVVQLRGQITKIEPGVTNPKNDKGSNITLKNGEDEVKIFLRDKANAYTGDIQKPNSWQKITDKLPTEVLKVGDNVVIEANAPLDGTPITPESFYGWWYLKM
jgi:hypothetical protein